MKKLIKYIVTFSIAAFIFVGLKAQNKTSIVSDTVFATGIVVDAITGLPVQGVKVDAEGIFSALTDETGKYKVRLPYSSAGLTLSLDGYLTRNILSQEFSDGDIKLYSDAFVPMKEDKNAYSITPSVTVENELQTRFAGDVRSINRSAATGIGSNLYIRGFNSLNMNAQPLIVVDGTVWENIPNKTSVHAGYYINSLADIDVNDIESVEFIKDASSIYGSKGANGILLIKTIRSRSEVTKISFDAMYGLNLKPTLPEVMNAGQFRAYASELLKGLKDDQFLINQYEGTFLNEDRTELNYSTFHNDNDWSDDVYRTGSLQRYGFNVQGGDDVAMYHISLGYTSAAATVKASDFSRLNTRVNSDINLGKQIKISTNIYFSYLDRNLLDDGVEARTSPTFISQIKSPFLVGYRYTALGDRLTNNYEDADIFGVSNPVALLDNSVGKNTQYRFGISPALEWKPFDYLTWSNRFSYTVDNLKEHYFSPMLGTNPVFIGVGQEVLNTVKDQTIRQISVSNDMNLQYSQIFNYSHKLKADLGFRIYSNSYENAYGEGYNTGDDNKINLSRNLMYLQMGGVNDNWNSASLYLQAQYSYQDRYNVWAIAATDASSRFGSDTKDGFRLMDATWALFPSAGVSWEASKEAFMRPLTWLNKLNLRASYGITGNDDIGNMARFSYMAPVNYLGTGVGLQIDNLENQSLQWETTSKMTAGVDLAVWDDKLNFSFDVFKHLTSNLLTLKQANKLTGLSYYWSNDGKLENTGWSLGAGAKLVNQKNFKWNLELTVSHYKNRIKSLPDGDYTTNILGGDILTSVGNPAGVFYGYKTHGVFASDAASREAYNGVGLRKQNIDASYSYFRGGDIHFDDKDGNGIINDNDRQIIGDPNPDFTGVIYNSMSFGRFDLSFALAYSLGNDVYNYQRSVLESAADFFNQSLAVTNRWKAEGQVTDMPKATLYDPMGNSRFSDRWIEDGSYLKLKDVRLSYKVPVQLNFLDGLTVWLSGSNLYTWTKYLGSDPETSISPAVLYQGIDNGLLSAGRSFYFGIKLNL